MMLDIFTKRHLKVIEILAVKGFIRYNIYHKILEENIGIANETFNKILTDLEGFGIAQIRGSGEHSRVITLTNSPLAMSFIEILNQLIIMKEYAVMAKRIGTKKK